MSIPVNPVEGQQIDPSCTCNDEYRTSTCPIHYPASPTIMENVVVIHDTEMVQDEIRRWMGYVFKCPKCQQDAIMDFCHYCCNCGAQVVIKSHKVTDFVKQLEKSMQKEQ